MKTSLQQPICNKGSLKLPLHSRNSVIQSACIPFKAALEEDTFTQSSSLPSCERQSLPIDKDSVLDKVFSALKLRKSKTKKSDKKEK